MTIQPPPSNHTKSATEQRVPKENKQTAKVASSLSPEKSYKKIKMIHDETAIKLNRKKNKTSNRYSWDLRPFTTQQIISLNNKDDRKKSQISQNQSVQQFIVGLQTKSCTEIKLPPLEGTKIHKLNPHNLLPIPECDVMENSWDIRNLGNDKNQLLIDHEGYIRRQSTCILPFKSKTQVKPQLSINLNRSLKEPTLISQLFNSMSSLRLDNRHDMAANDHVRHHIKRQQQWIRSDQVRNWRKSPMNRVKKQYPNSTSSGQKSDVISGNSDESLHTTSTSSETNQFIDFEYDEERKQAIDKCTRWMNDLPAKFSGLHILDPAKS